MPCGEFTEEYEIYVFSATDGGRRAYRPRGLPRSQKGDRIQTSLQDCEGHQTCIGRFVHLTEINKTFSAINRDVYDAVYCAGGRGPEYLRTDKPLQSIVRHLHETQEPIFTICHGAQILIAVDGIVRGKRMAALGACEREVSLL